MNTLTKVLTTLVLLVPAIAKGETLVVSDIAGDTAWIITLVGAYQMDGEIWMTSDMERAYDGGHPALSYPMDSVEADLPSIVAKHVGDLIEVNSRRPLLLHGTQIASFDFDAGDGWVDTEIVGWLYIREYPWVYHVDLGWLWVVEGPISGDFFPEDESLGGGAIKKLTFYFFSSEYGWMWKSPYTERSYVFDREVFLLPAEINAG